MPAMPTPQADAYQTPPDSSQTKEPEGALDMHYYLTEGLEGAEHYEYRDICSFTGAVDSQADVFRSGKADESPHQYLIFSPVTPHQLANIDSVRETHYKKVRILYLNEPEVLIVKHMPSPKHQLATLEFQCIIIKKIYEGGQGAKITLMGSTTY